MVFTSLVAALTATTALLLALSPQPLLPDSSSSLLAVDSPHALDAIFQTQAAVQANRWQYVYVHHSRTPAGSAAALAQLNGGLGDHFVIGNGNGCVDGEIQIGQRWNHQLSATPPQGADEIDPACISICLVGDFDQAEPTRSQFRRLSQLVATLQQRFNVPASHVLLVEAGQTPASIGRQFPADSFRGELAR